ncbi:uncharacterized protein PHALS_14019 [Plasmopara halstedii]|uniref:Uncharacterized protein n=1 Tax=Plasmopara halstedii TaxID=4781 RepID=A0A0P1AQF9_PLAHL|nr:uncharacterized protein PHALS_14019 [Plasmopara halstedii]CEG43725.1 hypothetical protein PHALS_14019 [Plasmopara halstedii]|eukprot:XP_024580094.1 hypothetical protein PHALS_14019 [Plasmopara halstedii]
MERVEINRSESNAVKSDDLVKQCTRADSHSKPPLNCISVTGKWKKLFREAFPKTRNNFFDEVVRWVLYLNKHGLYDVSKALALLISV